MLFRSEAFEYEGRLVVSVPGRLHFIGAAADVARLESDAPRQFPLHADRELVHVRDDEVRVREAGVATEERPRPERTAGGLLDAVRPRVAQRIRRRAVVPQIGRASCRERV